MKAIDKLKKYLPQFTWTQENSTSSIFGTITAPQVVKRINKDLYKLDNVNVFISSKMGGTPLSGNHLDTLFVTKKVRYVHTVVKILVGLSLTSCLYLIKT